MLVATRELFLDTFFRKKYRKTSSFKKLDLALVLEFVFTKGLLACSFFNAISFH